MEIIGLDTAKPEELLQAIERLCKKHEALTGGGFQGSGKVNAATTGEMVRLSIHSDTLGWVFCDLSDLSCLQMAELLTVHVRKRIEMFVVGSGRPEVLN